MGYTRSLLQLRTSLLIRGQYESSFDITPTVANEVINDALEESYNLIVERWDDFYTIVGPTFTTVFGTDTYALPTDFYKLRKVELLASGVATDPQARWRRLFSVSVDDAHLVRQSASQGYKYRLTKAGIVLVLAPATNTDTLRLFYIPLPPQLALDTDTVQFDTPVEQKLVLHIALRDLYQRQDLPTQDTDQKILQLVSQLRSASDHDAGEPVYLSSRTGGGSDPYQDDY